MPRKDFKKQLQKDNLELQEIISSIEKRHYAIFKFLILTFFLTSAPLLVLQIWSSYAK